MLKDYLKQKNISIQELAELTCIDSEILERVAEGKLKLKNVPEKDIAKIAKALGITS